MFRNRLKKIAIRIAQFIARIIGKKNFSRIIVFLARIGQINLLILSYNRMGIDNIISGESYLIKTILKKEILNKKPVLFDVGANQGDYSKMLSETFPAAKIFAIEPTLTAYKRLQKNLSASNVEMFNIGFSFEKSTNKIYSYKDDLGSSHSSIFKEVFTKIHHTEQPVAEMLFECTTIDEFCIMANINFIDFIKIDTEGNELNILKGGARMITENKIRFIQFEFNEMNIISRVFLKDFYDILKQYDFYRISERKLIPLGAYNSINEIFKFQNILAVNKY